jgi:archaellum component FlaD/FlaE
MAVNQAQVDHIITAASEDDPEVKLQNLEREVDLLKTSIKRLLMDIRERMNELENPFTISATGSGSGKNAPDTSEEDAKKSALEARESALDAREANLEANEAKTEADSRLKTDANKKAADKMPSAEVIPDKKAVDDQMLSLFKEQLTGSSVKTHQNSVLNEKLRLQKVYKLFKWTSQAVRKFGHDRLEIIIESYRIMGYISKESCDEIKEISRLMPADIGEEHEVGPDEFVSELYALNRILAPSDTSLDRDMIEVMMEQRQQTPGLPEKNGIPSLSAKSPEHSPHTKKDDEWMNLPDRI